MVLLKEFAIMTVLLHLTIPSTVESSFVVDGCFSSIPGRTTSRNLGRYNSNHKCQIVCKDLKFIIAATKGNLCRCGNVYPEGKRVKDSRCATSCRSWSSCHGPSSCCGGRNAYSVSVVGDVDVAKHVLQRLSVKWQKSVSYRRDVKGLVQKPSRRSHIDNWWSSFDSRGWSTCGYGRYMIGMYRNKRTKSDPISRIEKVDCYDAPGYLYSSSRDRECYKHNWYKTFDRRGWAFCNNGYYMAGLYRSSGNKLSNIEKAYCCRPKTQVKQWGHCLRKNNWKSFNRRGWSDCPSGYYMTGLYRNKCNKLYCLEEYYCCKMGSYIGQRLVVRLRDNRGNLRKCSMDPRDKSITASTFQCTTLSGSYSKILNLNAKNFILKNKTPFSVFKLQPIPNFRPVVCSGFYKKYTCRKRLSITISESSTLITTFGFSTSVTRGFSASISSGKVIKTPVSVTFSKQISKTKSFSRGSRNTKTISKTDTTDVSINVPPNDEITINLMKSVQDLTYQWKAEFELDGWYSIEWNKSGLEKFQAVNTVLSGPKEKINAFGTWKYPRTGVIKVLITDKYGKLRKGSCEHKPGKAKQCRL
ncbi:uncharacterized protein LOC124454401 [Xenia sp. Carnegie-2017]|uniref:uncharacterized protein LOC124454401 n=1 Tax=Xenia sp. Carnegie-2017 TaxID=2897299 RepID=UPI001F036F65|nr:uncharacterized protein LOC124454401 [Xenia sp. Carnegie-2017]